MNSMHIGKVFSRLTVLDYFPGHGKCRAAFLCKCECGKTKTIKASGVIQGKTKSCGCFAIEIRSKVHTFHGCNRPGKRTTEYSSWASMRRRCETPSCRSYHNYGARGISVCLRWRKFENFLADMGKKPTPLHSIERIDNNGSYEPANCRWATQSEQSCNTRRNKYVSVFGVVKTIAEHARDVGVNPTVCGKRLLKGWPAEEAFTPVRFKNQNQRKRYNEAKN